MKKNFSKLHKNMSIEEFENGYFYATELKVFAKELSIEVGTLKKNELEIHIKARLFGNKGTPLPKSISNRKNKGSRDKLSPEAYVINYVSDKNTKAFLKEYIFKRDPALKDKSGQWYWLNDWRKDQIRNKQKITYQELIDRLYELMTTKGRLPRIPSTRFNNFITDFLTDPDNAGAARKKAMKEWEKLKKLPIQKNYQEYKKFRNGRINSR